MKLKPRNDLKARITLSGHRYAAFARTHGLNERTLYAVLDGRRTKGPEAKRIVQVIELKTPAHGKATHK